MTKTILLTGATDGIGLETAKQLAAQGHTLLLHGRNHAKLMQVQEALSTNYPDAEISAFLADLSMLWLFFLNHTLFSTQCRTWAETPGICLHASFASFVCTPPAIKSGGSSTAGSGPQNNEFEKPWSSTKL